ncbi:MAG TPA: hypothetical protein VMT03_14470 [Polyangia bacterium]|nr:hypothetical protein [Polyangia bacterium]
MEKRRGALLGLVIVALLGTPGVARADKTGDKTTEKKAVEDFAAGRYEESLDLFAKLYADTLNPVYLRNIGRCQQNLRHPDKAIDAFKNYLAKAKKISADERAEINGYIKEMEALRDEQARQAQAAQAPPTPPPAAMPPPATAPPAAPPATATSPVQPLPPTGEAPPPGSYPPSAYPPGSYAPPPGYQPGPEGQQPAGTLVAQPGPPPAAESGSVFTRWWFWTIVGAVVVGGVVAAVVLSSGTDKPPCSVAGITGLMCK